MKVNVGNFLEETKKIIQKKSDEAGAGPIPLEVELSLIICAAIIQEVLNTQGVIESPVMAQNTESFPPSQTFSYIKYNEESQATSEKAKAIAESMERLIGGLGESEETRNAKMNLEQTFMWIGKAIKRRQLLSEPNAQHLEARNNN